jgi:predicted secreted protein
MPELNIQADKSAGVFRVLVDGEEITPDYILIKMKPGQDARIYFGDSTGPDQKHKFLIKEFYYNAHKKIVKEGKYGTESAG